MKTVTDTLGLARSSIAERVKGTRPKRGPQTRDGDLGPCRFLFASVIYEGPIHGPYKMLI
jgi:hypothetical protein